MPHVEITVTVDDRTIRYEADVEDVDITESKVTGEIAIRPQITGDTKRTRGFGHLMVDVWQQYLTGPGWEAADTG